MNVVRKVLTLILCTVYAAHGNQTTRQVHVGGDVPKPGPVNFEGDRITLDSASPGQSAHGNIFEICMESGLCDSRKEA